ncbi:MAG: dNTP triphosphohydrolase [Candidatus Peribacteraceae bacterium]|nr:dNTP triphosphohydrolase [Candidatus Peribacteraceae bacterium]MDD5075010.1 dNTP triphosphohydrolase [Candidatus Peribacteraceae bacterium]
MLPLADRITQANTLLAPYAVPHQGTLGRVIAEAEDETRFPFQRDRDRIIHTQAFRRLKGKTQVFVAGGSDHVRTRLTHTMEVAQVSRDIARTLQLNEDLAECIALAHDLGHPPFGHAGEEVLNSWMEGQRSSFEHNRQSLRIVTVLEEHSSLHHGLNLNREILEGLQKHTTPHDAPEGNHSPHGHTLEAQIVNLADEIAYSAHDCDDGLQSRLFTKNDLLTNPLGRAAAERAKARGTSLRGALIHLLVTDLYQETEKILSSRHVSSLADVLNAREPIVRFSPEMSRSLGELHDFLWKHLYLHPRVQTCNDQGKTIVLALCTSYEKDPPAKVSELMKKMQGALIEAICDYVSGMTDAYALHQARVRGLTKQKTLGERHPDVREEP